MKFSVVWQPSAEQEHAELWQCSTNRAAVALAADRIEQVLRSYPDRAGEGRTFADRVLFEGPLGVRFRLSFEDRKVQVLSAWDITRR